jgi:hypothetical protein
MCVIKYIIMAIKLHGNRPTTGQGKLWPGKGPGKAGGRKGDQRKAGNQTLTNVDKGEPKPN